MGVQKATKRPFRVESFLIQHNAFPGETLPSTSPISIALVEDDVELAKWVCEFFEQHAMLVRVYSRGDIAVDELRASVFSGDLPDLVILDVMLPGKDGYAVCRDLREFYQQPILIMTANDQELDEVLSLELGADDFIPKPVRPRILLARVKALLRRAASPPRKKLQKLSFGALTLDESANSVVLDGQPVSLSSAEFELLWVLARQAGEILSRQDLSQRLRGIDYDGFDRTIDVRISRLRKKLGDDSQEPVKIKTIWGKGYLFVSGAW
ncbi:MAG: DNA-binding response regulator [Gammaproteobacteria bacterium]|nr:MAG: DNA-binding response regulator [Gammaproteobacteria bacterium]